MMMPQNSETRIRLRITGQGKDIVTAILCRARPVPFHSPRSSSVPTQLSCQDPPTTLLLSSDSVIRVVGIPVQNSFFRIPKPFIASATAAKPSDETTVEVP